MHICRLAPQFVHDMNMTDMNLSTFDDSQLPYKILVVSASVLRF